MKLQYIAIIAGLAFLLPIHDAYADSAKEICEKKFGNWVASTLECEEPSYENEEEFQNYCKQFNGVYLECSSCRGMSDGNADRVCTSQCYQVCDFSQGKTHKMAVSAGYAQDAPEEGQLIIRAYDELTNQTATDVILRLQISKDGDLLARNIYDVPDGTLEIIIQPIFGCPEDELWKCTTYYGTTASIAAGIILPEYDTPKIKGPVFLSGKHELIVTIEEARIDASLVEQVSFTIPILAESSHPCFNAEIQSIVPCNPDQTDLFYKYKGETWMEQKKQEMIDSLNQNRFHEWVDETKDHSHFDVYLYYSQKEDITKLHGSLPPLKQIKNGAALSEIQCRDGYHAVPRLDRMMIACVYPDTVIELINRGWAALRLGGPATDNLPRDLCGIYDGKWISESKECINLEDPLQCSLMGGAYNECASACRNDPAYPDVACDDVCVEVCHITQSTLEDIMNNPVVDAFYAQYGEMNSSVSGDRVSYHAGDDDGFSARLSLYFDKRYNLQHIEFHCYEDKQHRYEIAQEDILNHLQNYHCETFGKK
ncbi:MAG: hypothetical protein DWQ18_01725 [Crenarchaeota archaeon]|nr:MAG: hypothetical protein DWQ17_06805 [Thermoproteota archaeon]RDJ33674.1 MAG: hypothetical protein DWQ18_01725 [Thermoproteota archaeon]RDJ37252.1 MAG: hypothetical protein DWQ19_01935 [Thermoproteota archaeon]RDJ39206.1 MAG: hypothetical protein DWQ13_02825 [Thermoproteota archaeon]